MENILQTPESQANIVSKLLGKHCENVSCLDGTYVINTRYVNISFSPNEKMKLYWLNNAKQKEFTAGGHPRQSEQIKGILKLYKS